MADALCQLLCQCTLPTGEQRETRANAAEPLEAPATWAPGWSPLIPLGTPAPKGSTLPGQPLEWWPTQVSEQGPSLLPLCLSFSHHSVALSVCFHLEIGMGGRRG